MRARTIFGFLPPRLTYSSEKIGYEEFPLPTEVNVLIRKDLAAEGLEIRVGGRVKSGQRILSTDGSTAGFSSVTGTVAELFALNLGADEFTAIRVTTETDEWDTPITGESDFLSLGSEELSARLRDAGFETGISEDTGLIIVNCLESDLCTVNRRYLLLEKQDAVVSGIRLLKRLAGCEVTIAVTKDLADAAGALSSEAEVRAVKGVYPNGMDELLTRRIGGEGVVVIDIEYLCAMVSALTAGRPYIEKVITLIDRGCVPIKNLLVRVGTPVKEILRHYNISSEGIGRIVLGGPMRGKAIYNTDFPVTAATDAVLIQDRSEAGMIENQPCLSCGKCVQVCPYNLQACLFGRYSEFSLFERCEDLGIEYCIECGLCSYVCTSRRPLVQYIQFARGQLEKLKREEMEAEGAEQ